MNTSIAILGTSLFGVATLYSILAIWMVRTRLPWLVQSLIVIAAILPMLIVRAGDLVIVSLAISFVILGVGHYFQHRHLRSMGTIENGSKPNRWPTISLIDLMQGVILFCVVAAFLSWGLGIVSAIDDPLKTQTHVAVAKEGSNLCRPLRIAGSAISVLIIVAVFLSCAHCFYVLLPPEKVSNRQPIYRAGEPNGIHELVSAGREISNSPIMT